MSCVLTLEAYIKKLTLESKKLFYSIRDILLERVVNALFSEKFGKI